MGENPALESVKVDVETAREVGLGEERIVASHADPTNAEYLLEETDCRLRFTIGCIRPRRVRSARISNRVDRRFHIDD